MPTPIGAHADLIADVRALLAVNGRREQRRFAFEGATLLDEAMRSGTTIAEIYATESVYEQNTAVRALERDGVAVYIVDERTARKISDLETPTGLVSVAALQLLTIDALLARDDLVLVLADLNDPGNAGTLLRSAEAFGVTAVVFGALGVDPHHPKVVRGAMGAGFRLDLGIARPEEFIAAARTAGTHVAGLSASGEPLDTGRFERRAALIVGHERRGLGAWESACDELLSIPMRAMTESLNAAVAGSIALYEAGKRAVKPA